MGLRIKFSIRAVLLLIAVIAISLAFQMRVIRRHNEAAQRLLDRGGQFDFTPITLGHWATRSIPRVEQIAFFGPRVNDEAINDIVDVASTFGSKRISLVETLVTPQGVRELKMRLTNADFRVITPGLDSPRVTPRL